MTVRDGTGTPVRRVTGEATAGLHRVAWDLRLAPPDPVRLDKPEFESPWATPPRGPLVAPGAFSVELGVVGSDGIERLAGPEHFEVKPVPAATHAPIDIASGFGPSTAELARLVAGACDRVERAKERMDHLKVAIALTASDEPELSRRFAALRRRLLEIERQLVGDPVRQRLAEAGPLSVTGLVQRVADHDWGTTSAPTATQRSSVERAAAAFSTLSDDLTTLVDEDLAALIAAVDSAGGPWTPR